MAPLILTLWRTEKSGKGISGSIVAAAEQPCTAIHHNRSLRFSYSQALR